jgi:hypothetical protein
MFSLGKTKAPVKPLTPTQVERAVEADLIQLQADIKRRELEEEAAFRAELAEHERNAQRAELDQKTKAVRSTAWAKTVQGWTARFIPFAPLYLVNSLAVLGQVGWGRNHLTQVGSSPHDLARWAVALLFAATLESIALFLIYFANRFLERGDSASSLYVAAFGVSLTVAGINYSHYAEATEKTSLLGLVDVPAPTAMAVVFALCSVASPWLWRIKHRDANRARLAELGVIDTRAVKLSMASKIYYPIRSFQVTRKAVWDRETNPIKAVENWEAHRAVRAAAKEARRAAALEAKAELPKGKTPKDAEPVLERVDEDAEPPAEDVAELPPADEVVKVPAPRAPTYTAPLPAVADTHPSLWDVVRDTDEIGARISARKLAKDHAEGNRRLATDIIGQYAAWKGLNEHVNRSSAAAGS